MVRIKMPPIGSRWVDNDPRERGERIVEITGHDELNGKVVVASNRGATSRCDALRFGRRGRNGFTAYGAWLEQQNARFRDAPRTISS